MVRRARALVVSLLLAAMAGSSGCSSIPADPDGTLARVEDGVLRVGVSPHEPWTVVGGPADPSGIEPDLVRDFAATLRAQVVWQVGGEERLVDDLEQGRLDLVIGGLTADSPWSEEAAITEPYAEGPDPGGIAEPRVMAATMGENAFLLELERFLADQRLR